MMDEPLPKNTVLYAELFTHFISYKVSLEEDKMAFKSFE